MTGSILVFVFLLVGVAITLGLYALIEAETSNPTVVDRREAEREAKARGGLRGRRSSTDSRERDETSSADRDSGWNDRDSAWDDR